MTFPVELRRSQALRKEAQDGGQLIRTLTQIARPRREVNDAIKPVLIERAPERPRIAYVRFNQSVRFMFEMFAHILALRGWRIKIIKIIYHRHTPAALTQKALRPTRTTRISLLVCRRCFLNSHQR